MAAAGTPKASALPAALDPFVAEPAHHLAVMFDFDGFLSPIVDDPASAYPDPAARDALEALAPRLALVACVTGRSALQARELLGLPALTYSGLHGAELLLPGADAPIVPDAFAADAERVAELLAEAEAESGGLAGLDVERKGPIVALHWRRSTDPQRAEARALEIGARAEARGLRAGAGRAVLELRPGLEVTKGDGVRNLLARVPAATGLIVGGDDVTDLDAFAAATALHADGTVANVARIAVSGPDAPPQVAAAADVVLPDPAALGVLLQTLAAHLPAGA